MNGINEVTIISERIVNIGELEAFIRSAYMDVVRIRTIVEEGRFDTDTVLSYLKTIQLELLKAKDFDFYLERRNIIENNRQSQDLPQA